MDVLAYVLMSNHYHVVIRSPEEPSFRRLTGRTRPNRHFLPYRPGHQNSSVLSQCFRRVMHLVARKVHEELELRGHFWEQEFHSRRVADPFDFLVTVAYDHLNPVRQGMASLAEEFPQSSAAYWVGSGDAALCLATRGLPFEIDEDEFRRDLRQFQRSEEFRDLLGVLVRQDLDLTNAEERASLRERLAAAGLDPAIIRSRTMRGEQRTSPT